MLRRDRRARFEPLEQVVTGAIAVIDDVMGFLHGGLDLGQH
jgi:hypothetical protein